MRLPAHEATTAQLGAAVPLCARRVGCLRGVFIGRDLFGGSFVYDPFELYRAGAITNPNMVVLGQIGRGKSAFVKTYLLRQAAFGRRIVILDPKGEYGPFARALGAEPIVLRPGGSVRLNPLSVAERSTADESGDVSSRRSVVADLASACLGRSLGPAEHVAIDLALDRARRAARSPTLSSIVTALLEPSSGSARSIGCRVAELAADGREVGLELRRLVSGELAGMFDGATTPGVDLSRARRGHRSFARLQFAGPRGARHVCCRGARARLGPTRDGPDLPRHRRGMGRRAQPRRGEVPPGVLQACPGARDRQHRRRPPGIGFRRLGPRRKCRRPPCRGFGRGLRDGRLLCAKRRGGPGSDAALRALGGRVALVAEAPPRGLVVAHRNSAVPRRASPRTVRTRDRRHRRATRISDVERASVSSGSRRRTRGVHPEWKRRSAGSSRSAGQGQVVVAAGVAGLSGLCWVAGGLRDARRRPRLARDPPGRCPSACSSVCSATRPRRIWRGPGRPEVPAPRGDLLGGVPCRAQLGCGAGSCSQVRSSSGPGPAARAASGLRGRVGGRRRASDRSSSEAGSRPPCCRACRTAACRGRVRTVVARRRADTVRQDLGAGDPGDSGMGRPGRRDQREDRPRAADGPVAGVDRPCARLRPDRCHGRVRVRVGRRSPRRPTGRGRGGSRRDCPPSSGRVVFPRTPRSGSALAEKMLGPLLLAAAASGRRMADVVRWVDSGEVTEVLDALESAGASEALSAAQASFSREDRQLSSVYATVETLVAAFADPAIAAATASHDIDADAILRRGCRHAVPRRAVARAGAVPSGVCRSSALHPRARGHESVA